MLHLPPRPIINKYCYRNIQTALCRALQHHGADRGFIRDFLALLMSRGYISVLSTQSDAVQQRFALVSWRLRFTSLQQSHVNQLSVTIQGKDQNQKKKERNSSLCSTLRQIILHKVVTLQYKFSIFLYLETEYTT